MTDRISWQIKDEAILSDLRSLMAISASDEALLTGVQAHADAAAIALVDDFYGRLLNHEATAEYIGGLVDHLRVTLQDWFVRLFQGNYDEAYVRSRLQIGKTHVRIGLPVRYPLAMMDLMIKHGHAITTHSSDPQGAQLAFNKLMALDIAIFNQAYENRQLQHLSEMVGNERLARRLLQK
jgi:hypothetical protein